MPKRAYCPVDQLIISADTALRTIFGAPRASGRANPAARMAEPELTDAERRHAAGLMRVNHSGEVCAQGLYQGQALTARLPQVRQSMEQAAIEENDHLKWCEERLQELESRKSLLTPDGGEVVQELVQQHGRFAVVRQVEHLAAPLRKRVRHRRRPRRQSRRGAGAGRTASARIAL